MSELIPPCDANHPEADNPIVPVDSQQPVDEFLKTPDGLDVPSDTRSDNDTEEAQRKKLSVFGKIKELAHVARTEIGNANWRGKLLIAGLVGMTAYEYGPGNEVVTPILTRPFIESTHSIGGIALATSVAAGSVAAQQLTAGWLARKTVNKFPKVTETVYEQIHSEDDKDYRSFKELSIGHKLSNAFFLGSTYNVIRESILKNQKSEKELRKISRTSSFLASVTVASAAMSVDVINYAFPTNEAVQTGIDIATHPALWVALGVGAVALDVKNSRTKT